MAAGGNGLVMAIGATNAMVSRAASVRAMRRPSRRRSAPSAALLRSVSSSFARDGTGVSRAGTASGEASGRGAELEGGRKLLVVDGTALLYRAFHAYSGRTGDGGYYTRTVTLDDREYTSFHLRTSEHGGEGGELSVIGSDGSVEVTSATYGFMRQLLPTLVQANSTFGGYGGASAPEKLSGSGRLLLEKFRAATHLAVCFDSNVKNFRHELFPMYKKNRVDRECPDGVIIGKKRMVQILRLLGVAVFESEEGYEADDIIGSLCAHAVRCGVETEVMSNDKDFMQLLRGSDPPVSIIKPAPRGGGLIHYSHEDFLTDYPGLGPENFVDVLALSGDASDGIPGLKRIGPKTALKLLRDFGSVEEIFKHGESIKRKDVRGSITAEDAREAVELYRRLVTIRRDVDVGIGADADVGRIDELFRLTRPADGGEAAMSVLAELEMFSLIEIMEALVDSLPRPPR